jgi:hypothetical protein
MSYLDFLTIILVVLKLTGHVDCSWIVVLMPTILPNVLWILIEFGKHCSGSPWKD